jgi:hypothetical protein
LEEECNFKIKVFRVAGQKSTSTQQITVYGNKMPYSRRRAPRTGFSDWPAQRKNNEKKGRPLKFFIHGFKLQAGTSDDDHHT